MNTNIIIMEINDVFVLTLMPLIINRVESVANTQIIIDSIIGFIPAFINNK